ncbi:MGMT family protein [Arthrobacter sp.]|uniref:MGMT family protein n=1 Tax=Arthrobacter sp. TaxID=1667 RepID=UPI002811F986|nr:MGMT family protein [Arthrobacter sp.]
MRTEYVEAVIALVELVPAGSVLAYGDVSELLDSGGPRQVGAVMGQYGNPVPWWRVLRASGEAPSGLEGKALRHYLEERTPLRGDVEEYVKTGEGRWRVDIRAARWTPSESDFDLIDDIARRLAGRLHELSVADDGMSG